MKNIVFFLLLLAILITGTLQIDFLKSEVFSISRTAYWAENLQNALNALIPANTSLGIEGVSVQGLFLIGLLICIAIGAVKGLEHVDEGFNWWSYFTLTLISFTLLFASTSLAVTNTSLRFGITGRFILESILITALWASAKKAFTSQELGGWLWETWRFVKQIIPLLLVGVFTAGMARALIPANWIASIAGRNTIAANFIGVVFGVFMYFPTLVEVPIAQTFLSLGMHRGPLLAYLLADPELSLQSILITSSVFGKKKTAVYVILVTIFSTLAGLIFGMVISP